MKKNYFDPASLTKRQYHMKPGHLSQIMSRRSGMGHRVQACYLTDAEKTAETEVLMGKIKTLVTEQLATRATTTQVQEEIAKRIKEDFKDIPLEALRTMADPTNGVMKMLTDQGIELQKLQTSLANAPKDLSIRSQVKAWQEANKTNIERIKAGEQNVGLPPMEIRAAVTMGLGVPGGVDNFNTGGSPFIGRVEIEPGINPILRYPLTFWDFLTKGKTSAVTYGWVNMVNPQGAAAFIAPGELKPGVSFSAEAATSLAKKVADSAKATTEILQDIDGMTSFIEQELRYQVMAKVNSKLMDNVVSDTEPQGIKQYSVAYTLAGITTDNPNYMDAIRAVVAQLRSGKLTGPITVFINSVDAANMDMSKAKDSGTYLLPPFVTADGRSIAGAQIIEDPNIPVGTLQAGFMQFYRVLIYKDFSISWGWVDDDFTRNLVTAVGEMRLHQFVNNRYTGAFVRDTFANIVEAIKAPVGE